MNDELTTLEKKELQLIWNEVTDYGREPMTYEKYLIAGHIIMAEAYKTGKSESRDLPIQKINQKTLKIKIMTETKQRDEKAFAIHNVSNCSGVIRTERGWTGH